MKKRILFVHSGKALLPEMNAYNKYFSQYEFWDNIKNNISEDEYNQFDLLWFMMGTCQKKYKVPTIHEYASLSTGSFPRLKNYVKKLVNSRPDLRIFLNREVENGFSFSDNIPTCYRDMGVDEQFFKKSYNKEWDFVYVGSMDRSRSLTKPLEWFKANTDITLLMIGQPSDDLYNQYKSCSNIVFTGIVDYSKVPELASTARFGLNYIPYKYPFYLQTSTKLLEYAAMGLNIVTTDYPWVRMFEKKYKMKFYYINEFMNNLDKEKLYSFCFRTTDIKSLTWNNIIRGSGIYDKLNKMI